MASKQQLGATPYKSARSAVLNALGFLNTLTALQDALLAAEDAEAIVVQAESQLAVVNAKIETAQAEAASWEVTLNAKADEFNRKSAEMDRRLADRLAQITAATTAAQRTHDEQLAGLAVSVEAATRVAESQRGVLDEAILEKKKALDKVTAQVTTAEARLAELRQFVGR